MLYKFVDDQGNVLAALITYYAFVSLFPLLLLLVTLLGYALHGNEQLQADVLNSALSQFPVIGEQLRTNIDPLHGKVLGLVVGILGSLYGGLGVAQACQNAMNKIWAVPRNARPNPLKARGISLLLLLLLGGGVLATTVLSALTTSASAYGSDLGVGVRILEHRAVGGGERRAVRGGLPADDRRADHGAPGPQRRAGRRDLLAAAAGAGHLLRQPRPQGRQRHLRGVRPGAGPAGLDLPRRAGDRAVRRVQRGPGSHGSGRAAC